MSTHVRFWQFFAVLRRKAFRASRSRSREEVWTAAVTQLEIGEKANFRISPAAADFDPEGLAPNENAQTWTIELLRVRAGGLARVTHFLSM